MAKNPSETWFYNDWENDEALKACTLAAQGLWVLLIGVASRSAEPGIVQIGAVDCRLPGGMTIIARAVGRSVEMIAPLIDELLAAGVAEIDQQGRLYSRRLVRKASAPRHHQGEWLKGRWLAFDPFRVDGLPTSPGVYIFFADGRPLYVGQTSNLALRLGQHRFQIMWGNSQRTPWRDFPPPTVLTGKLRVSRRYGDWAMQELRLIRRLRPMFNVRSL